MSARKIIIEAPQLTDLTWPEFFERQMDADRGKAALEPMPASCADCAVVDGLYLPIAEALTNESDEVRTHLSERWFCHNNCTRACRGNWDLNGRASKGERLSGT